MQGFFGGISESAGLYGSPADYATTAIIEWFIFQVSPTQPTTPTGGTFDFANQTFTPPSGWSNSPPASPTSLVWSSISFVTSNSTTTEWSTPGQFAFSGASIPGGIFGGSF
jgi:hypothetical protein